jgi:hypothetical protein
MKNLILLLLLAGLVASCSLSPTLDQASLSATQAAAELEEQYAVYDGLITLRYISPSLQRVVIYDHTGLEPSGDLEARFANLQENFPELTPQMVVEFKAKNASPSPLESRFILGVDYVLVSDEQLHQLFAAQDGWLEFYKQFPLSQGVMTLSQVAFNPSMDLALVYVGNQSGWLAGAGYYLLMEKENGVWKILKETMAWIS